ncbi:F-box/kelch-repeat protein At3g06240-like isoform X2 [Rutidosis leptorrhynchoides]
MILAPEDDDFLYSVGLKQLNTQISPVMVAAKRLNFLHEPWLLILGSCNGLLLAYDIHENLYLINPTTRKSLKVPDSGEDRISLTHGYGFGYDSSKDDYKVISISSKSVLDSDLNCSSVLVYSLRNNSWNKLPNMPYLLLDHYDPYPGILLNDYLHWVTRPRHSPLTIVAFSLADEKFHEIELPDLVNFDIAFSFQLYAFGGKLFIVLCYEVPYPEFHYELWVMEEYGVPKSWKKLCVFQNDIDLTNEFIGQVSNWDILSGNYKADAIRIYNMDERRCASVKIEGCPEGPMVYGTYVETLESLERFH